LIEEIKEEKMNKVNDNIKYLEDISNKIENSINELKKLFQQINESKEDIKTKISNTFTKLRNAINEREDEIILEVDNIFDKKFMNESIIKQSEKLPNKIKISLKNGKALDKQWDDNKRKLNSLILKIV
jgi:chromosome segregation ATPase